MAGSEEEGLRRTPDRPSFSRSIEIARPGHDVKFIFPDPSSQETPSIRIVVPGGSAWSPSPHWHEKYTECFRVIQGKVVFELDGKQRVIDADAGVQIVGKGQVHKFWRADVNSPEEVVVEEWTDPADGSKEVFFRNLFGAIQDAPKPLSWLTILRIKQIEVAYDNWPVVVYNTWCRRLVTHLVQRPSSWLAWLLGDHPFHQQYVPIDVAGRRKAHT